MKDKLILVVSNRMSSNKKKDRNEDSLIRMSESTRSRLGLEDDKTIEVWPDSSERSDLVSRRKLLSIFKAYSSDIKKLREDGMPEDTINRVGFVTQRMYDFICGNKHVENIYIADSVEDIIVGADPEFLLMDGDEVVRARNIPGFENTHRDTLGQDGSLAELRPQPDSDVNLFVNNIKDMLTNHPNTKYIDMYDWVAGCVVNGFSVGGHIHIGTPLRIIEKATGNGEATVFGFGLYFSLLKILDELVALPMIRIDGDQKSIFRRRMFGYFGEFRYVYGRLEYRTLSGAWLSHPEFTKAIVGTVKAISHAYFKYIDDNNMDDSLVVPIQKADIKKVMKDGYDGWKGVPVTKEFGAVLSSSEMISQLNLCNIEINSKFLKKIGKKLCGLPTYNQYKENIDMFIKIINMPNNKISSINYNIKDNWLKDEKFIV